MRKRSKLQYAYLVMLFLLGAGSIAAVVYRAADMRMLPNPLLLVGITLVYVLSDYYTVSVETATPGSVYVLTVADAPVIFALIAIGPYGLIPILVGSIVARYLDRRLDQPLGYLFNLAHLATAYCLWFALETAILHLGPAFSQGLLYVAQLSALLVMYFLWNIFFFSLLISIGSKQPALEVYQQKLTLTVWIDIIPMIMGALAAIVFAVNSWLVLLVIVPIFLAFRAMIAVVQKIELTHALQRANAELTELNARLEQRVAERTADLERALHAKDDFVSVVTHELRTPLTSIIGSRLFGTSRGKRMFSRLVLTLQKAMY